MKIKETEGKQGNLNKNYEVLLRKYSLVWIHKYVLWKRTGETWYFSEFCRSQRGYEVRDLAQGETERHKFKCNLESDFKKAHGGVKGALGLLCLSVRQLY